MLTRVAVGVDGSEASWAALTWAYEAMDPAGTVLAIDVKNLVQLHLEYAMEAYGGLAFVDDANAAWEDYAKELEVQVQQRAEAASVHTTWTTLTAAEGQGGPAHVFVEEAKRQGAKTLVVGQHRGYSHIDDLIGGFSHAVAVHSHLPTVIVPPPLLVSPAV